MNKQFSYWLKTEMTWDALHPVCAPSNLKTCSLSCVNMYFHFCVNLDAGNRVQFCSSLFLHSVPTFSGSYTNKREQKIVAFRRFNCNHLSLQFQKVILLMFERQGFLNSVYEILFSEGKFLSHRSAQEKLKPPIITLLNRRTLIT